MRIRSISYFFAGDPRRDAAQMAKAGALLRDARARFTDAGFEVQTVRLVLQGLAGFRPKSIAEFGVAVEDLCRKAEIDYATVGALRPTDSSDSWEAIPSMLSQTERVFAAGLVVDERGVRLDSVRLAADIVHRNAQAKADGFQNLRFAALGNVPAGVPFLPAAYHEGPSDHFSIATESADVAVSAFDDALSLDDARSRFLRLMQEQGSRIVATAEALSESFAVPFGGIDFSLAPFPRRRDSIGAALESLGLPAIGRPGSAAAAAFLTSCLDAVELPRCGFCGLFLPVLEDEVLAASAAAGNLGVSELLLASTVCGTGLDTVPLPGSIEPGQLAAILLDMAAISVRLDKPLTARLMPMPGKRAGDELKFDFPYFASGRVLDHSARALSGFLAGDTHLPVDRRRPR